MKNIFMVVRADDPQLDGFEYDSFNDALRASGALWRRRVANVVVELDPADDFLNDWEVVYEVRSDDYTPGYRDDLSLAVAVKLIIYHTSMDRFEQPRYRVVRRRRFESIEEMIQSAQSAVQHDEGRQDAA